MSNALLTKFGRKIRWGMVGGGIDSLIGDTHRLSARVDDRFELVAGALSIDPEIAEESAKACLIDPSRSYSDFRKMAEAESLRDDGVEVVTIATPPHLHAEASIAFLERGIAVICEKPLTKNLEEALRLQEFVEKSDCLFALTHCYTGYPMVREARELISSGLIGEITQIQCDFPSGPFMTEERDPAKKHWRFKPEYMGKESILGEIGSHAYNMASFVTSREPTRVSAHLRTLTPERQTFDDAQIVLEYPGGRLGRMWLSFVASGNEHGLSFKVHGTKGALEWHQEQPETLWLRSPDSAAKRLTPGFPERMSAEGFHACRLREGHPEGYILAFANLYRDFADAFIAKTLGMDIQAGHFPGIVDGVGTMRFYEAASESNANNGAWVEIGSLHAKQTNGNLNS